MVRHFLRCQLLQLGRSQRSDSENQHLFECRAKRLPQLCPLGAAQPAKRRCAKLSRSSAAQRTLSRPLSRHSLQLSLLLQWLMMKHSL